MRREKPTEAKRFFLLQQSFSQEGYVNSTSTCFKENSHLPNNERCAVSSLILISADVYKLTADTLHSLYFL